MINRKEALNINFLKQLNQYQKRVGLKLPGTIKLSHLCGAGSQSKRERPDYTDQRQFHPRTFALLVAGDTRE